MLSTPSKKAAFYAPRVKNRENHFHCARVSAVARFFEVTHSAGFGARVTEIARLSN
jgi:hypothetical protein